MKRTVLFCIACLIIVGLTACQQAVVTPQEPASAPVNIWLEAEDAFASNFDPGANPTTAPLSTKVSGMRWLEHRGRVSATARMSFKVPIDDDYRLYVRMTDSPFSLSWRVVPLTMVVTNDKWQTLDYASPIEGTWLPEKKSELVWVDAGRMTLKPGSYFLELRLASAADAGAALDCFLLTNRRFLPDGPTRPELRKYNAEPGTWPFISPERYSEKSVVDLRYLNHRRAGDHGFLKRKGEHFVFEKEQKPTRFFGINIKSQALLRPDEEIDAMAEMLARRGVNLVQVTMNFQNRDAAGISDNYELDRLHYAFSRFKKSGIYTGVSLYSPETMRVDESLGIPGYGPESSFQGKPPWTLLLYQPEPQARYLSMARMIFRSPNPYTMLDTPIADDTALAYVQIFNDSLFSPQFKPGETIPLEAVAPLEEKYFEWAVKKYTTPQAALAAWNASLENDDVENKRLGLLPSTMLSADALASAPLYQNRASDQSRFFTKTMRDFYINTTFWFEYEIGLRCPVLASSLPTVDEMTVGPLERYAAMSCDAFSATHSFAGQMRLQRPDRLTPGDLFKPRQHLKSPYALRSIQYADYPLIFSNVQWPAPNPYRADAPIFSAAYSAIQGVDALIFADLSNHDWALSLSTDTIATPSILGQFPVAALLYRRRDLGEAPVIARQTVSLESMYDLKGTGISEPTSPDPMRYENPTSSQPLVSLIDPYAFYTGRVQRLFGEFPEIIKAPGLSSAIDRNAGYISSHNGRCIIDFKRGLCTIDTPRTQAALGVLNSERTIPLSSMFIESGNTYGAISATALDGLPLELSKSILIQVATPDINFDFRASEADPETGFLRIEDPGATPVNVRNASGKIAIKRKDKELMGVLALDANGNPGVGLTSKRVRYSKIQDMLVIELEPDVIYYHILPAKNIKY